MRGKDIIRDVGGSKLMLACCILFTVNTVLCVVGEGLSIGIVITIFDVLFCAGLWLTYSNCTAWGDELKTGGLRMLRTLTTVKYIFYILFAVIAAVICLVGGILSMNGTFTMTQSMLEQLAEVANAYGLTLNVDVIDAAELVSSIGIAMIILFVVTLVALLFIFLYFRKLRHMFTDAVELAETGAGAGFYSGFVQFALTLATAFNFADCFDYYSALSTFWSIVLFGYNLMFVLLLMRYKKALVMPRGANPDGGENSGI